MVDKEFQGCKTLVNICANLRSGEKALIISDETTREIGDAIFKAAKEDNIVAPTNSFFPPYTTTLPLLYLCPEKFFHGKYLFHKFGEFFVILYLCMFCITDI